MQPWKASPKSYPHFGKSLTPLATEAIVKNPKRVASHPFFPLISFEKRYVPYRKLGVSPKKKKSRLIRYASSLDANIFSYYRHILSERYETVLSELQISSSVTAYRKIPITDKGAGGKCNIHFAKDAFDSISELGNCCAIALDISAFFESLDHRQLKEVWCRLIGVSSLPPDHFHLYKTLIKGARIDRDMLYEQLGYSVRGKRGVLKYKVAPSSIPRQLCSSQKLREIIGTGKNRPHKLVQFNKDASGMQNCSGIPQGVPISDLLASAYLIEFDCYMVAYVKERGGRYFRYSDDILIVLPGDGRAGHGAMKVARRAIKDYCKSLEIKKEKSKLVRFKRNGELHSCTEVGNNTNIQGLEYLGFRFDGQNIFIRNSTISGLRRKMRSAVHIESWRLIRRYPRKDQGFLEKAFNAARFVQRFGRVPDFENNRDYRSWTFWSYTRKAAETFGSKGRPIYKQLRRNRELTEEWLAKDLKRSLLRKSKLARGG